MLNERSQFWLFVSLYSVKLVFFIERLLMFIINWLRCFTSFFLIGIIKQRVFGSVMLTIRLPTSVSPVRGLVTFCCIGLTSPTSFLYLLLLWYPVPKPEWPHCTSSSKWNSCRRKFHCRGIRLFLPCLWPHGRASTWFESSLIWTENR